MGLTVGELNVQLEASTKEFNERLDEAEERIEQLSSAAEEGAERTRKSFLSFAKAIGTLNIAIGTTAAGAVGFRNVLRSIGIAIPQVRVGLILIGSALAALGLSRIGREGIQLAAAFEQTEVALETLTGSASAAAIVLETVNEIVLETPFALTELANVARTMAIVFGDSADTIAEFTRITADIAAISGKNVEQIGQQIQRAVVSGLASAEVLRESGITQLLVEQSGAISAAELSGERLLQAFRDLTAEGGRAFRAAARQTQTLAGALSNAEIAATSFTREFGKALSPATIIRANAIEDAFVNLRAALQSVAPIIVAVSTIFNTVLAASFRAASFSIRGLAILVEGIGVGLTALQVIIVGLAAFVEGVFRAQFDALRGVFKLLTGDIDGAVMAFKDIIDIGDSPVIKLLGNVLNT
ncbi:MAG: tape measure protein, partial [Phycisphaerales bacterium]